MNLLRDRTLFYVDYVIVGVAFVLNLLSLLALLRSRFHLAGYRRFLVSLCLGDLYMCCVNFLVLVYYFAFLAQETDESSPSLASESSWLKSCSATLIRMLKLAGFTVNLLNLCGMSLDHLLGIASPIKYHSFSNSRMAQFAVIALWIIAFGIAFIDVPIGVGLSSAGAPPATAVKANVSNIEPDEFDESLLQNSSYLDSFLMATVDQNKPIVRNSSGAGDSLRKMLSTLDDETRKKRVTTSNVCISISDGSRVGFEITVIVLALCSFVFLIVCYITIFRKVSNRIEATVANRQTKKLIVTTLVFLGAFTLCWLPFMIFELSMLFSFDWKGQGVKGQKFYNQMLVGAILNSILMCYPLIDPIIYVSRIPTVQRTILVQLVTWCPSCTNCAGRLMETHTVSLPLQLANTTMNSKAARLEVITEVSVGDQHS